MQTELQQYIQKVIGYSLTGNTDEQSLFFVYGEGANGKTTFFETMKLIFGDYIQKTDIEALLEGNNGNVANPYIARLKDIRFAFSSETPSNKQWNEKLIKDLTGGNTIVTRQLYKEPVEFKPKFKLFVFGNYKPPVKDMTFGFWRRMRVIPFTVRIPDEIKREQSEVINEFKQELSGILSWAIRGSLLWKEQGLKQPKLVLEATQEYKVEEDTLQQFISEECELGNYQVDKNVLLSEYNQFLFRSGEKGKVTKNSLTRDLKSKGIVVGGNGRKFYIGLRIITDEPFLVIESEVENTVNQLFNM